ncbi:MAG TPA: hypothetical protein VFB76_16590 [Candidatus Angelobacter sp.]|nr:hypothetical protein [Candidatus Angelobacter sp.]
MGIRTIRTWALTTPIATTLGGVPSRKMIGRDPLMDSPGQRMLLPFGARDNQ